MALIMGQKAQLWWDLPAADCFLLLREIYRIPEKLYRENLAFLAETLRVTDQLTIQIRRLSLGERMKMELIAALLHNPRVVYLDEPTIGLDLTAQRAIREFILEYRRRLHPAMIVTSHYMEDIKRLCKRIVIIRRGSIVYDGDLASVVAKHAHHKVIAARLRADGTEPLRAPAELGETLEQTDGILRLKTHRETLPGATAWVLGHHDVEDLTIEDEDISTIIEALLREG
jgi:ABC-2 type transport system ATP-binding protein